jgi:hypothetical protein
VAPTKAETAGTKTPDTGVAALLAQLKNLPVSQVDALLDAIDKETGAGGTPEEEDEDDDDVQVDDSSVSRKGPVRYAEVEPGMQKAIAAVHNHMMEEAVKKALDSDQELSYNMAAIGPKARESVVSILKDHMERQIAVEGDRFDYNWARVAQNAMAKAGPIVAPFFDRPTPRAGMGPGSGSDYYMARPLTEPKRVPAYADSEDYAAYLQAKVAYNAQLAERETQSQISGL